MMDQLIHKFPAQLNEALEIGAKATINMHEDEIHEVYVAGLGGSGIGANFVADFVRDECPIPYTVGKGYSIPKYVNKNTLVILSSYSGNTEETLEAFELALKTGAKIVCISSGGTLISKAKELGLDYIQVPSGWPSPRACLGYTLVQQLFILHKLELISNKTIDQIRSAANLLQFDSEEIHDIAKKVAVQLNNRTPIIYTTDRMESVAVRFRQQINENAKMLCWHHTVPEMNHNELTGWAKKNDKYAVVYFRNKDDYKRNQVRIDINKKVIEKYTPNIIELWSKGSSLVEKAIYFVHLGDWVSWYLSELQGVDALEIKVIEYLKAELAKA